MPPAGFVPTVLAGERPQTYALDRAATGTGHTNKIGAYFYLLVVSCSNKFFVNGFPC